MQRRDFFRTALAGVAGMCGWEAAGAAESKPVEIVALKTNEEIVFMTSADAARSEILWLADNYKVIEAELRKRV